jgi:regulator of sirC expression with transglutaminase-like and TPR domain
MHSAQQELARLSVCPDEAIDLPRAALTISALFQPDLDTGLHLRRLESLCIAAAASVPCHPDLGQRVRALNRFLFEQEGFGGNLDDFYDPRNSFLDQVIKRRTGIPITLSLLYVEVARQVGIPAFGVGFPGHFLVRVGDEGEGLLMLDPFSRGISLDLADLDRRLAEVYGDDALRVEANPGLLRPATRHEVLVRMLSNLKALFLRGGDLGQALIAVDGLLALSPDSPTDLRDRGLIYRELGYSLGAAADLRRYLRLASDAEDSAELWSVLAELEEADLRLH